MGVRPLTRPPPNGWSPAIIPHASDTRARPVHLACPPNPDPGAMRVPRGHGMARETLDDEADQTFGGTDRDQVA